MVYTSEELNSIYDKTGGYCNICGKKLAFSNYGRFGEKGAWEVDHSNPVSNGGSNYYRNLYPVCIPCNRAKSNRSTAQMRATTRPQENDGLGAAVGVILLVGLGAALLSYLKKKNDENNGRSSNYYYGQNGW